MTLGKFNFIVPPENTHRWGKYHCTAGLQFDSTASLHTKNHRFAFLKYSILLSLRAKSYSDPSRYRDICWLRTNLAQVVDGLDAVVVVAVTDPIRRIVWQATVVDHAIHLDLKKENLRSIEIEF